MTLCWETRLSYCHTCSQGVDGRLFPHGQSASFHNTTTMLTSRGQILLVARSFLQNWTRPTFDSQIWTITKCWKIYLNASLLFPLTARGFRAPTAVPAPSQDRQRSGVRRGAPNVTHQRRYRHRPPPHVRRERSRGGFDMSEDTRRRSGLRARQAGEEARRVVVVGRVVQGRVRVRRPREEKEEGRPSKNSSSGDKLTKGASAGEAPAVRANASWTRRGQSFGKDNHFGTFKSS